MKGFRQASILITFWHLSSFSGDLSKVSILIMDANLQQLVMNSFGQDFPDKHKIHRIHWISRAIIIRRKMHFDNLWQISVKTENDNTTTVHKMYFYQFIISGWWWYFNLNVNYFRLRCTLWLSTLACFVTFILMHMIQTQEYKSRLGLLCPFLFMSIQQWTQYLSFKIDTGVSKQTLTNN